MPGVPGIGVKTAAQLIGEYGDLETLLKRAKEIKQDKRRQSLIDNAEIARISKRLVTLDQNVPLDVPVDELAVHEPDYKHLIAFLKAMEFNTITRRVAEKTGIDASAVDANAKLVSGAAPAARPAPAGKTGDLFPPPPKPSPASGGGRAGAVQGALTPISLAAARAEKARAAKIDRSKYECVRTLDRLKAWIERAHEEGVVAVDTETTSLDPMQAGLCGFSLALSPNEACYVPLAHRDSAQIGSDLFAPEAKLLPDQIAEADGARPCSSRCWRTRPCSRSGRTSNSTGWCSRSAASTSTPYDDTMLMSYVLDAGTRRRPRHGRSARENWLGHKTIHFADVAGTGKSRVTFDCVAIDKATEYAAEDADVTLRLWHVLKAAPCRRARDRASTRRWSGRCRRCWRAWSGAASRSTGRCSRGCPASSRRNRRGSRTEIKQLAGEPLNPGSPKQLGDILFGKMGLPGGTKTKTGQWSTGARVLDELAEQGHELPRKILDWRQRVEAALDLHRRAADLRQSEDASRAHNLRARGDADRAAVVLRSEPAEHPGPHRGRPQDQARLRRRAGHKLVSADYSQIELRLLAEIADIPALRQAFTRRPRHSRHDGVAKCSACRSRTCRAEVRRRAKAINFGIIYGISAFGLANQLGIAREEAGAYIKKYFERFPGIRDYMDETKAFCREHGYVRHAVRPQVPLPGDQGLQSVDPRLQRARGDQRAAARHRRRHHPPRHGAHGGGARRGRSSTRRCCCRCTTN